MDTNRFKSAGYKRQILNARAYKRPVPLKPESAFTKLLRRVGLGSAASRIFAVLIAGMTIYLIYFAPFMMIGQPKILGSDSVTAIEINSEFQQYKKNFEFIFPQKNIVFFNSSRFAADLYSQIPKISKVLSVSKHPWRHIEISVSLRTPAYDFVTASQPYILNSDGNIGATILALDPALPVLRDTADEPVVTGQNILDSNKLAFLNYVNQNFSKDLAIQIDHFEMPGTFSHELSVIDKDGATFYFDDTADPQLVISRLVTLWATLKPEDQKRLAYIDLRFDSKAYGCYKADKCAGGTKVPMVPATTPTPTSVAPTMAQPSPTFKQTKPKK